MSEPDLRPAPSTGYTPQPTTTSSGTWWKSLKFRLGIIILIAIVGLGFGLFRGVGQRLPKEFTLLPESQRPAREEVMRRAIDAFYANPSQETGQASWDAIFAWRRTFPDADPASLEEASAKVVCGTPRECDLMNDQSKKEQFLLVGSIINKYAVTLPTSSIEYHARTALELAIERRITAQVATELWIAEDLKKFKREKELEGVRERFFNKIDEAVRNNEGQSAVSGLLEYLKVYADAASGSFREIKFGRMCPPEQSAIKDGQLCEAASRAVNGAYRRDQATRVTVAKQAIKDRDAPREVLQAALTQIFQ